MYPQIGGTPEYYSIQASTSPSEGPFPIGSVVHLYCNVSPDPPSGSKYEWRTSVPGVTITQQQSTNPNATITIPGGHTKYGYYYCQIQNNDSILATGFTVIEVKCKQILSFETLFLLSRLTRTFVTLILQHYFFHHK